MKRERISRSSFCGPSFCVGLLGVCAFALVCPIVGQTANAESEEDYGISTQADATTLTLTMSSNPDTSTPSSTSVTAGTVAYRPYTFKATTNGAYRVFVQAASGYTGNLKGLANPNEEITGVGTNVATSAFPTNTWGYSLTTSTGTADANLTYSTVPENGVAINAAYTTNTAATSGQNFKLVFAAKIGDKPADHYQTKVLLSLAAGPTKTTLLNAGTMQNVDKNACLASNIGDTTQLRDVRDQKLYWVAKLADGNCWMTQNLAYNLGSGVNKTIYATNTDLNNDQANLTIYGYNNSFGISQWTYETDNGNAPIQYYNTGLMVHVQPTELISCNGQTSLNSCTDYGLRPYEPGDDEHYLVGNYYSWSAATAGTPVINNEATGSICPKNWKLPHSGNTYNNTNGSFYYLLNKYGLASTISNENYNISAAPLYFLRSGWVGNNPSVLNNFGYIGGYYSRSISSNIFVYHLVIDANTTPSSERGSRYAGLSVRCVVI